METIVNTRAQKKETPARHDAETTVHEVLTRLVRIQSSPGHTAGIPGPGPGPVLTIAVVIHAQSAVLDMPAVESVEVDVIDVGMLPVTCTMPGGLAQNPVPVVPHTALVSFRSSPEYKPLTAIPTHCPVTTGSCNAVLANRPLDGFEAVDVTLCKRPGQVWLKAIWFGGQDETV